MHVYYALYNKHRWTCPVMNRHLIYLCIFKVQKKLTFPTKLPPSLKRLWGILRGLKWVTGSAEGSVEARSQSWPSNWEPGNPKRHAQSPLPRVKTTSVPSAGDCCERQDAFILPGLGVRARVGNTEALWTLGAFATQAEGGRITRSLNCALQRGGEAAD